MKKSKSLILGLAVVLGVAGAFTTKAARPLHGNGTGVWWSFNGTQGQISDPSKYSFSPTEPGCSGAVNRCAVLANRSSGNPAQPDLSTITQEDLKN